jgi:hypothetical protein
MLIWGPIIPKVELCLLAASKLETDRDIYWHYTMAMDVIVFEALQIGVYNYVK